MKQPSELQIRSALPGDSALIASLVHELAVYERAPDECHATEDKIRETLFGDNPAAEAVIGEWNGKPCGFALFFHNYSTWECSRGLYVEDIFVRPAWRRQGVGRALLAHLARIAVDRGCERMDLSVLDWNKPARDFYAEIGFEVMTEWVPCRAQRTAIEALAAEAPTPVTRATTKPDASVPSGSRVVVHTDGGSQPNPGVGAWAAVLRHDGETTELVGGALGTTNNRMELSAAIGALEALDESTEVELHTDSAYLKNGITSWIKGWKRNGWKRGKAGVVKNADLWKRLDALCAKHTVEWRWLRGHAGHEDNERCDLLCNEEIERLTESSTSSQRDAALATEKDRQAKEEAGIMAGGDLFKS